MKADEYEEKEIFPGVYLTDFRKSPSTAASGTQNATSNTNEQLQISMLDLKEIQNKIYHLERSNNEMKEFDASGVDPVIQESIQENLVLIEEYKHQERVMMLQLELMNKHQLGK